MKTCVKCKVPKEESEFPLEKKREVFVRRGQCKECRREYYRAHDVVRKESRIAYKHEYASRYYREQGRNKYQALRKEVLSYYSSGKLHCEHCGENIYEFLALDHINGDLVGAGARDRKRIGSSSVFLHWIKKNSFPTGFRVLCHNCNHLARTERWKSQYHKEYYHSLRREVLNHYGLGNPHCVCCGYETFRALSIDHENGDGGEHRRQVGRGQSLLRWLKVNEFPNGYRILCHNCNHAISQIGYCPHELFRAA